MAAELGKFSIPAFMPQCQPIREWRSRGPLQADDATPLYTHPCTYQSIDVGSDAPQHSGSVKFCKSFHQQQAEATFINNMLAAAITRN